MILLHVHRLGHGLCTALYRMIRLCKFGASVRLYAVSVDSVESGGGNEARRAPGSNTRVHVYRTSTVRASAATGYALRGAHPDGGSLFNLETRETSTTVTAISIPYTNERLLFLLYEYMAAAERSAVSYTVLPVLGPTPTTTTTTTRRLATQEIHDAAVPSALRQRHSALSKVVGGARLRAVPVWDTAVVGHRPNRGSWRAPVRGCP